MSKLTIGRIGVPEIGDLLGCTASVGWGIASEDVRIMIENPKSGALLARMDGVPAGSGCWSGNEDGSVIFISLITVKEEFRRSGIATKIMNTIFDLNPQAATFRLLATDMGMPLYDKMGFATHRPAEFMGGTAGGALTLGDPAKAHPVEGMQMWMEDLDSRITAPKRRTLLRYLAGRSNSKIFALDNNAGFIAGRIEGNALDVSMIYAPTVQAGLDLLAAFVRDASPDQPVDISVAEARQEFRTRLQSGGFQAMFTVTDMVRGEAVPVPGPECLAMYSYIG